MLSLFPELGVIGGGLGGAAGAVLGQIGDILSAPRKFFWDLAGARGRSGSELISDWTGEDKDSFLANALGLGMEVLGDPLTIAGGVAGSLGGRAAGRGLTHAAQVAGPGYASDISKLSAGAAGALEGGAGNRTLVRMLEHEPATLGRIASEIPEGYQLVGGGGEALAWGAPGRNVVRAEVGGVGGAAPLSRTVAPEILQPARNVTTGAARVEHLPMVGTQEAATNKLMTQYGLDPTRAMKPPPGLDEALTGMELRYQAGEKALTESALKRGLEVADSNIAQNVGRTAEGKWLTFDPGVFSDAGGTVLPVAPSTALNPQAGGFTSWLAAKLGGQGRLRKALETPFSTVGQGI